MSRLLAVIGAALAMCAAVPAEAIVRGKPVHGIAIHGDVKYAPGELPDYVNPNAPKGGTLTLSNANDATFDTFNPFTLKGASARGLGLMYDTLMSGGSDEASTASYCHLCETIEVAPDNSWTEFKLRKEARFSDGSPLTAEDVVFTFNTLLEKGVPFYRVYYSDVASVEARDASTVRFIHKNTNNNELPSILGQLVVLPRAYWEKRDFAATTLDIPIGSGPYMIDTFEVGRQISYKRNEAYWAKDLPMMRGQYNFDRIRYEYYRDDTVLFESFKTGGYDFRNERMALRWATGYDFPALKNGQVKLLEVPSAYPMDSQGFALNMRRAKFADRRVRQAMNLAFDFESLNKTIFYNQYTRVRSYWQRSELEAKGLPSPGELALLEPLRDKVPPEVFTQEFNQPVTDGSGAPRDNLLKAKDLLEQAGWVNKGGVLVNTKTGEPFTFEVLLIQESLDRIVLPWVQNLERLGIKGTIRVVDTSQYINRITDFDYDVTTGGMSNTLSPGNEQLEYWGSASADRKGSRNIGGVKDPAVDALINAVMNAKDRESLVTATHALDRVLQWNQFTILHYNSLKERYAYWAKLEHPEKFPLLGLPAPGESIIETWWMGSAAAQQPGQAANQSAPSDSSGTNWPLIVAILAGVVGAGVVIARRRRQA